MAIFDTENQNAKGLVKFNSHTKDQTRPWTESHNPSWHKFITENTSNLSISKWCKVLISNCTWHMVKRSSNNQSINIVTFSLYCTCFTDAIGTHVQIYTVAMNGTHVIVPSIKHKQHPYLFPQVNNIVCYKSHSSIFENLWLLIVEICKNTCFYSAFIKFLRFGA